MLVLTRRRGQTLLIGDDIKVTILDVSGDQVRIGIEAPRNIPVYREEVFAEIVAANQQAAAPSRPITIRRAPR